MPKREGQLSAPLIMASMIGLILVLGLCRAVSASSLEEAEQMLESLSQQMQQTLAKERHRLEQNPARVFELVEDILIPRVDFDRFSYLALGKHWKHATSSQREAFVLEFRRMLVRTYATVFLEFPTWDVEFLPQRDGAFPGNDVQIRAKIHAEGIRPVAMNYRVHRLGDQWQVYDVAVEGISLATSYRSSFNRLVRQRGLEGLIAYLRERNNLR